ncbi:MAG TPA: AraC family transcriptional regulator [Chitinispirillaceae bacterium]|nr:AraC family transcriptional regulator [Chitinispirillaceae bacterium]
MYTKVSTLEKRAFVILFEHPGANIFSTIMETNQSNKTTLQADYRQRINRVIDYIDAHLDENLTLETLAYIACFSKFHFHRIFQSVTGERLSECIQRLRLLT